MKAYFDNSATTKATKEVGDIVMHVMLEDYGNPSAMHMIGVDAEKYIKDSKAIIAKTLKVEDNDIYFTSGGTECNNLALFGVADANKRSGNKIITTKIEHPSVSDPMKKLEEQGFDVKYIGVDENGVLDIEEFKNEMDENTILVSVMHVNNEVGAIQPIEEVAKIAKAINPKVVMHVDAIQSYGKFEIRPKKINVDILSVSGHKIHGPKGVGFIYIKKNTKINPVILGGGQQNNMRSGTENVPGIAGLGVAAKQCYDNFSETVDKITELKDYFIEKVSAIDGVTVNSRKGEDGAPHIVSVSVKNVRAEVLLHALEDVGVYISAGSACSSNKPAISATLKAMGIDKDLLGSTVRFSFSRYNTKEEIDYAIDQMKKLVPMLSKYVRR